MQRQRRVLLVSYAFWPSIGGIESVSHLVARGLRDRGYETRVVSATPGDRLDPDRVPVLRMPTPTQLVRAIRWADVVVLSNVSLSLSWPLIIGVVRRPWLVVNHTPIGRPGKHGRLRDRVKQMTLPRNATYAVSGYLRSTIPRTIGIMPNPYDVDSFFAPQNDEDRTEALLFVGRLVRAKGLDVLIDALAELHRSGYSPHLTVLGSGQEEASLREQARLAGIEDAVEFLGPSSPDEVGRAMRRHQVLVIPSRPLPPEALPMVALEGIASGCAVIATDQGGLPEAVGDAGLIVPPEDPKALAAAIRRMLDEPELRDRITGKASAHLERFQPDSVLDRYESAIRNVVGARPAGRIGRI